MINVNLLPKNLRRKREPGYWRLIAVVFPLLVFVVAGLVQFSANQTEANRVEERELRQLKYETLLPDIEEQQELLARQRQLQELIAVRNAVRQNRIIWSDELAAMLQTLPAPVSETQPRVAFNSLSMQALDAGTRQQRVANTTYEGAEPIAEMSIQGSAINAEVLADYLLALQNSPLFGVSFQNAARDEETGLYGFSITVGALAGGRDE